jgi:tetratricopeptide (TPR) repeat protein
MMAATRIPMPSRSPVCARTRARAIAASAVAIALLAPVDARAFGPSELPTVTDEPTPPPEDEPRDDANLARAMEAFQSGSENYNKAKYDVALRDFLEAASLYASPDFQYNIGLCYEKLDKPEEAIAAFETYLKTKPDAPDRANVEDRVARLKQTALARKADGGKKDTPSGKPEKSKAARPMLITGDVLTGVGIVVMVAGGVGFGVAARGKSKQLDEVQNGGNPDDLTFEEAQALEKEGKKLETIQISMLAVGGAVLVAGVALVAVGTVRRKKAKAAGGTSARLVPAVGLRSVGLSLSGRF